MSVTVEQIEFFLCILVRITAFINTAPFFSIRDVPVRVKIGISVVLALLLFQALPYERLEYTTAVGFGILILQETFAGLVMGFVASASYHILAFTGHFLDIEMGFSMVTEFDNVTGFQVTVTANLYSYAVMLMLVITRMYLPIITSLSDSFYMIPVGKVFINPMSYEVMLDFIADYLVIGFRIALPMFAAILVVNVILGILAKVAPQMNMFVIGMQIKVLIGLLVLGVMIRMIGSVSYYIYDNMFAMMEGIKRYLVLPFQ